MSKPLNTERLAASNEMELRPQILPEESGMPLILYAGPQRAAENSSTIPLFSPILLGSSENRE